MKLRANIQMLVPDMLGLWGFGDTSLVKVVTAIRVICGSHRSACAGLVRYGFWSRMSLDVSISLSCLAAQLKAEHIVSTKKGVACPPYFYNLTLLFPLFFPPFHFQGVCVYVWGWLARKVLKYKLNREGRNLSDLLGERSWLISAIRNLEKIIIINFFVSLWPQ